MGMLYADVIVDITHENLDRTFQYIVPPGFIGKIEIGMSVKIPFGKSNRMIKGYVVGLTNQCGFDPEKMKVVAALDEHCATVEDKMIALAAFMKRNFGGTMIQALKTVTPAKQTAKKLEHRFVSLNVGKEELIQRIGECERKHRTAQARLLREFLNPDGVGGMPRAVGDENPQNRILPMELLTAKSGIPSSAIRSLESAGVVKVLSDYSYRNPVKISGEKDEDKNLSKAQQFILDEFTKDLDAKDTGNYLIRGITGSGKTEVYIQMIGRVIERGRQAIVLIPEISLTYQTLLRFYRRFGDRVSVMNSMLSPGEKYDQCERAKKGEIDVIIGPRSALFTPFPNLGLIIMDEEHENSYKSESTPKYHARKMAFEAARIHGCKVVMGSATPSVDSYFHAKQGDIRLFTLDERLTGGELPEVCVVDLREELKSGNRSIFSRKLQGLLEDRLKKGEQSILFLNRRGYAGFVSCRMCGHVMKCPHCDVSLSEHYGGRLICHYCGHEEKKPALCPECGSKYILGFKAGTEQIEEKVKEMFPDAKTLRMDGDTTRTKDSYEKILSSFANGEADVLIGTQMIVKGHDFPNVTLVGVLAADLSLGAGDYRCAERTFELLTQAVGRAGRGRKKGEAVIQTYQPDHYAVVFAAKQDYEGFYEEEILYREMMSYPPVSHMLAVQVYGKREQNAKQLAERLADVIKFEGGVKVSGEGDKKIADGIRILGPAAASIRKINDIYRFVFYIKAAEYQSLVESKDLLEGKIREWKPAENVYFDFDPMNLA